MSLNSLLEIAEEFCRRHPAPTAATLIGSNLKLTYNYSNPFTNSQHKK